MRNYLSAFGLVALAIFVANVNSHGFLQDPPGRNYIWKLPGYTQQPPQYDYQGVWCGNAPQDEEFSTCGICGDAPGGTDNLNGGTYGLGLIGANYTSGSVIEIVAGFQAAHQGFYEVELCDEESGMETNECFAKYGKLKFLTGSETIDVSGKQLCVPYDNAPPELLVRGTVQLPEGVTCSRCTIRWTYRTSYPPNPLCGPNPNPTQVFRNCADVAIF